MADRSEWQIANGSKCQRANRNGASEVGESSPLFLTSSVLFAISHFASVISHFASAISHFASAISHFVICHLPFCICHFASPIDPSPPREPPHEEPSSPEDSPRRLHVGGADGRDPDHPPGQRRGLADGPTRPGPPPGQRSPADPPGGLVQARAAAVGANAPRGIRLLPDPTYANSASILAYNRWVPIEPGPDYSNGNVVVWPVPTFAETQNPNYPGSPFVALSGDQCRDVHGHLSLPSAIRHERCVAGASLDG